MHRGKQGQGYVYELAYDGGGKDGSPFVTGLLDGGEAPATTGTSRGVEGDLAGVGRPVVGPWSAVGRGDRTSANDREGGVISSSLARGGHLRAVAES